MMRAIYILISGALGILLSLGTTGTAAAQAPSTTASDEFLILGNPNRGAGEPMIAVNPKDPNNIIIVAMATLNMLNGITPPVSGPAGGEGANPAQAIGMRTPNSTIMSMAVTRDGGRTWEYQEDPIRQGSHTRCADPTVAAGPDGTLYVGCVDRDPIHGISSDAISVSKDEGKTWTAPLIVIGNDQPYRPFAPGLDPIRDEQTRSPVDRPWLVVDQSTNTVYNFAANGKAGHPEREESFFVSSRDDGETWSDVIRAVDAPAYPQVGQGFAETADGVFAAAYVAGKSPGVASCPCIVFALSTDQGKSFTYQPVTTLPVYDRVTMGLVADPSRKGGFAIMTEDATRTRILVTSTQDGGKTWSPAANAGEVPGSKIARPWPWIAVSDKGDIAVAWRGIHADKTTDNYSTLSRDGGQSFSATLRVSHASSVDMNVIPQRSNFRFGDDMSAVAVQGGTVHMVFADYRAGFQGTWYAAVPIAAYVFRR